MNKKCFIKIKVRVEGPIYAIYLHGETRYFCSHYFKNLMLLLTMLGMKHNDKVKYVTQHYRCFDKLVVT